MPKEVFVLCLKCNWGIDGQIPSTVGGHKIIDGELANHIKKHHIETGNCEGRNLRHRDFMFLSKESIGSIMGSSYEVVCEEYNRHNLEEIRHDQVLSGYDMTDYIEMMRKKQ